MRQAVPVVRRGEPRVVDYLVDALAGFGVQHVFGVDGANIEDVYDALFYTHKNIVGIVAKHEFSAATMADGYARTSGRLGVVMATSGGGALNLTAGLGEAFTSRVPLLALVGQAPTALEGHGGFQDSSGRAGSIDAVRLFSAVSRYCARVESAADVSQHLNRAVSAALRGGPAVLLLPKDVQQSAIAPEQCRPIVPRPAVVQDKVGLDRLVTRLAQARRRGKVLVIAGDEVARAGARRELADLVTVLDASVGVSPDAKDVVDPTARGYCGVAGSMGHPELVDALRYSELCLLIGTRMPVMARTGLDEGLRSTPVASLGYAPPYVPSTHAVTVDLRTSLRLLTEALGPVGTSQAATRTPRLTSLQVPVATGPGLRYRDAVAAIERHLPSGTDVFADAGNTGAAVVHHLPAVRGGRFVVALGMGGMGYAFGAGIGSCFGRRRRTFVIAGDGAFYMHGMEIHTAVEHRLPVTFVVFNNNAHAMCVTREQLLYENRYSFNRFQPTFLGEGIAAMFPTLDTYSASTGAELEDALSAAAHSLGPAFVAVTCDPDELPPFLPFLPPQQSPAQPEKEDTRDQYQNHSPASAQ
ncbi:thiamine pyrophosphate-binding protein [Rhodococcus spelaei]|uniref:acetolactate synthase n=1 Tax=Rhodococcus spelaei TaxID=2546320 RepID=A0A541BQS2_9NOCA|nr:thiamine pyrophosphate-binding protein [Rhodococcus spelaei]TQF74669.1 thiamine pyrophosphate-binding protein [Rhodococcus spelaei]